MPPPNAPTVARVAFMVDRDSRKFLNILHMRRSDNAVLGSADLVNMCNLVADWWLNSYRHTCSAAIVGDNVVATKLDPVSPIQETVYIAAPGDLAGGQLDPADVSAAISLRTGLAGRKFRGRFYHFQPNGLGINGNDTFQGSILSSFTAVGNYLLSHAAAAALDIIIFHRSTNTFTDVSTVIVDQLVDSMRNRLQGRGI